MELLGERLKKVRIDKGYSIEQVSRETNIARRYLRALEEEDFSAFPGETYLVGFLHNYAQYLGLDSEEMVTLYKNMKLQEQPVPMEELLEQPKSHMPQILIISFILILGIGGGAFYKFVFIPRSGETGTKTAIVKKGKNIASPKKESSVYEVKEAVVEKYFKEGETFLIPVGDRKVKLSLKTIGNTVVFSSPEGTVSLNLSISKSVDLNGDGKDDINITVNDIDKKGKGAVIRFDRYINSAASKSKTTVTSTTLSQPVVNRGEPNNISQKKPVTVILTQDQNKPYFLTLIFRGYCFIRYRVDGGKRVEQYFNKGETLRLDVNKEVQLWISNSSALSARVSGHDVVFGAAGEVSVSLLRWEKNNQNGRYDLQLIPLY